MSREQRDIYKRLKLLIRSNSRTVPKQELKDLLCWVQKNFADVDPASAFTMSLWDSVGVKLCDAATHGDLTAAKLFPAYHVLVEIFSKQSSPDASSVVPSDPPPPLLAAPPLAASNSAEEGGNEKGTGIDEPIVEVQEQENDSTSEEEIDPPDPARMDPAREPDLFPLDPRDPTLLLNSGDSPKNNLKLTDWADIRRKAIKEGDFDLAHEQLLAMPVRYGRQNANPRWEPMTYDEIKDLRKAIKDSGLGSPYFKQLLKAIYGNYDLTPHDCRYVSSVILTESQYVLWDVKWRRLLNKLIENYAGGPNAALTIVHLAGDPPHERAEDQAADLPRTVLDDIKDAAQEALLQVQPTGSPEGIYTEIKQGTSEPFATFIDRLTQAIERQCKDDLACPLMLRSLAFANANDECKQIIQALPDTQPTLSQMIEACSKIGNPQHIATIQANIFGEKLERVFAALAEAMDQRLVKTLAALNLIFQQNNSMAVLQAETVEGSCYQCEKPEHVKKNCPEPTGNTKPPHRCPRCKKGKHYANQCRSKFDIDGKPLSGNSKKSARCHGATAEIVTDQQPGIFPRAEYMKNLNQIPSPKSSTTSPATQNDYSQGYNVNWQLSN